MCKIKIRRIIVTAFSFSVKILSRAPVTLLRKFLYHTARGPISSGVWRRVDYNLLQKALPTDKRSAESKRAFDWVLCHEKIDHAGMRDHSAVGSFANWKSTG